MATVDPRESAVVQTREPPMTKLDAVKDWSCPALVDG